MSNSINLATFFHQKNTSHVVPVSLMCQLIERAVESGSGERIFFVIYYCQSSTHNIHAVCRAEKASLNEIRNKRHLFVARCTVCRLC
jgi:hypothetical protein